jgi:hypothetical protein
MLSHTSPDVVLILGTGIQSSSYSPDIRIAERMITPWSIHSEIISKPL